MCNRSPETKKAATRAAKIIIFLNRGAKSPEMIRMSHITTVRCKVKFTDEKALIAALGTMGKTIQGTGAVSVVFTTPQPGNITNLTFMRQGNEYQARADQWGNYPQYEALVGKIGQRYMESLTLDYITKNHLAKVSQTTDEKGNIRIKVRSY